MVARQEQAPLRVRRCCRFPLFRNRKSVQDSVAVAHAVDARYPRKDRVDMVGSSGPVWTCGHGSPLGTLACVTKCTTAGHGVRGLPRNGHSSQQIRMCRRPGTARTRLGRCGPPHAPGPPQPLRRKCPVVICPRCWKGERSHAGCARCLQAGARSGELSGKPSTHGGKIPQQPGHDRLRPTGYACLPNLSCATA